MARHRREPSTSSTPRLSSLKLARLAFGNPVTLTRASLGVIGTRPTQCCESRTGDRLAGVISHRIRIITSLIVAALNRHCAGCPVSAPGRQRQPRTVPSLNSQIGLSVVIERTGCRALLDSSGSLGSTRKAVAGADAVDHAHCSHHVFSLSTMSTRAAILRTATSNPPRRSAECRSLAARRGVGTNCRTSSGPGATLVSKLCRPGWTAQFVEHRLTIPDREWGRRTQLDWSSTWRGQHSNHILSLERCRRFRHAAAPSVTPRGRSATTTVGVDSVVRRALRRDDDGFAGLGQVDVELYDIHGRSSTLRTPSGRSRANIPAAAWPQICTLIIPFFRSSLLP